MTRFELHDSYRILLHPFRKDLHRSSGGSNAAKAQGQATPPPQRSESSHQQTYTLPKTFAHYLPASLPGKVRPAKPPRKNQLLARRAAAAAVQDGAGGQEAGASAAEQKLARQHAEWDKASTTLRRVVYKAEYSGPTEMRQWGPGDEAMRGYLGLEAGDVDEVRWQSFTSMTLCSRLTSSFAPEQIDRSLLEADAPPGSTPPRKKKKKQHQQQNAAQAGQGSNGGINAA